MSTPTVNHPPATESIEGGPSRVAPGGRPGRSSAFVATRAGVALVALVAALLGGAGALLLLTGKADSSSGSTRVVNSTVSSWAGNGSGSTLDAGAVYASAAAGVVDITARSTGSSPSPFDPNGQSQSTASGSGSVIDGQGHILTAAHVVDGASSIAVTFKDGPTRKAELL